METSLQSLFLALNSSTCVQPPQHRRISDHAGRRRKQAERAMNAGRVHGRTRVPMNLSKRKVLLDGPKKPESGFSVRVRALRKLLPSEDSVGLDELLRDVVDYITCLKIQVNVMQAIVDVLSSSES